MKYFVRLTNLIMYIEIDNKHPDIIFLERRLRQLVMLEEYERAAVIKRWLDELLVYHHGDLIFK